MRFIGVSLLSLLAATAVQGFTVDAYLKDALMSLNGSWGAFCDPIQGQVVPVALSIQIQANVACTGMDCSMTVSGQQFIGLQQDCSSTSLAISEFVGSASFVYNVKAASNNTVFPGVINLDAEVPAFIMRILVPSQSVSSIGTECAAKLPANQDYCLNGGCGTFYQNQSACPTHYLSVIPPGAVPEVGANNARWSPLVDQNNKLQSGCSANGRIIYPLFQSTALRKYLPSDVTLANVTSVDFIKGLESGNVKPDAKAVCAAGSTTTASPKSAMSTFPSVIALFVSLIAAFTLPCRF